MQEIRLALSFACSTYVFLQGITHASLFSFFGSFPYSSDLRSETYYFYYLRLPLSIGYFIITLIAYYLKCIVLTAAYNLQRISSVT